MREMVVSFVVVEGDEMIALTGAAAQVRCIDRVEIAVRGSTGGHFQIANAHIALDGIADESGVRDNALIQIGVLKEVWIIHIIALNTRQRVSVFGKTQSEVFEPNRNS